MTRLKAYWRLMKRNWKKHNPYFPEMEDDEITDFDLRPYLGWMEEEQHGKTN